MNKMRLGGLLPPQPHHQWGREGINTMPWFTPKWFGFDLRLHGTPAHGLRAFQPFRAGQLNEIASYKCCRVQPALIHGLTAAAVVGGARQIEFEHYQVPIV